MGVANRLARLILATLACVAAWSVDNDKPGVSASSVEPNHEELLHSRLWPGDNFARWIGGSLPVTERFERFPQIESITAGDAPAQREVSSSPLQGTGDPALPALEPGAVYVTRVGGTEPIDWIRPEEPAARILQLRAGENWGASMGPVNRLIDDAAKGLGVSLVTIEDYDHVYGSTPGEWSSAWSRVMRGDALKVTVDREVTCSQPTFVMPAVHFVGSFPHNTRRLIERDLNATLAYSATELSLQAYPSSLTVVVANRAKAAFDKATRLGREQDWDAFRSYWQRVSGCHSST